MSKKHETLVTELGRNPKRDRGSVNPPVHHTSTLIFESFQAMREYEAGKSDLPGYARHGVPPVLDLEHTIATLEGGDDCCVTASGQSATVLALMTALSAGDHLLVTDSIYNTTRLFILNELTRYGVEHTFYNPTASTEELARLLKPNTKAIYCESPGSLTFEMQDIPAIAALAHDHGALVIADCTWATPLLQRPFDLGVDLSIQSVTKYMAGHSDLMMGSVTAKGPLGKVLRKVHHRMAMCPGPDNAYLALRGIRTLSVRLKQHEQSALTIAKALQANPQVARVLYPALPDDPGHTLWKRDMTGASGLFGVVMKETAESKIAAFVDSLSHFGLGYSWGGYESLIIALQPAKVRIASNWTKDSWIVRLNIGLEDVDDLLEDLERGFAAMKSPKAA